MQLQEVVAGEPDLTVVKDVNSAFHGELARVTATNLSNEFCQVVTTDELLAAG